MNWYKKYILASYDLLRKLESLKPLFIDSIQKEYNLSASGGLCGIFADIICDIVEKYIPEAICDYEYQGSLGESDGHTFAVIRVGNEAYSIDIPYCVYEQYDHNGNNWNKLNNINFTINDIKINPI